MDNESKEIQIFNPEDTAMSVEKLKKQIQIIHQLMREVMKKGLHYDTIPGCGPKPTLLKPGAEKICLTFRLAPSYQITRTDRELHREYEIICTLTYITTGIVAGQGVGCCSTMENKYLRAKSKTTHPPDVYNTCLKTAKKRALVDAILTCTAASDLFAQDIEEGADSEIIDIVQNPSTPLPEVSPAEEESKIVKLSNMLMEMSGNNKEVASDLLKTLTQYNDFQGFTSIEQLISVKERNSKQFYAIFYKITAEYKKFKEQNA